MTDKKDLVIIKNLVLGPEYNLSLAFIADQKARQLNLRYRGVNRPATILSFPFSHREGEILINQERVPKKRIVPLFIHGLLHLKGLRHGSKMEGEEKRLIELLSHHVKNNRSGARHRHLGHSTGGRRSGQREPVAADFKSS